MVFKPSLPPSSWITTRIRSSFRGAALCAVCLLPPTFLMGASLPAISRHLKVLEQASLIVRTRDGQHRRCRLNAEALRDAAEWLEFYRQFWSDSFDRLAAHLRRRRKPRARR